MKRENLTADELRSIVDYDMETGIFTWKVDRRLGRNGNGPLRAAAGSRLGKVDESTGYLQVNILGKRYMLHRLAFFWMTGKWPSGEVDHRDGDKTNTRWSNLRDVPRAINAQNQRRARADNRLGLLGVQAALGSSEKPFRSRITVNGEVKRLGYFATAEEAHAAYVDAKRRLHAGCTI